MATFDTILVAGCVVAALWWLSLSTYVLAVQRRRTRARASLGRATALLQGDDVRQLPLADRVASLRPVIEEASSDLVMHGAAYGETTPEIAEALTAFLVERWGLDHLERAAASHHSARSKWRRTTALRILTRLKHPRHLELLAQAADNADGDVASIAFSLLGGLVDPQAGEILIGALISHRHPASRVAVHLDRSPLDLGERLRPLLRHMDPVVRLWAAALIGRYPGVDGVERELVSMVDDLDPRVRKAAIESLGRIGDELAAAAACRLLGDPVAFVRATAVRALGRLDLPDLAVNVASMLGDRDWWVRFAAKQALEAMGTDVWPVLVRSLEHSDRFVRNGAAEVVQNLGILDSLIVMEAATDDPAPQKIDMLRRIASAGGARLTDSLVERAGPTVGPRVRGLLAAIGFADIGAA